MHAGDLIAPLPDLPATQRYAKQQLARLPSQFKSLEEPATYPVRYSAELERRRQALLKQLEQQEGANYANRDSTG